MFDTVLNLKTAKALDVDLPGVRQEVIE